MSTEDDDIRELDLGENPVKCEFCAQSPCICEEDEDDDETGANPEDSDEDIENAILELSSMGMTLKYGGDDYEAHLKSDGRLVYKDCDLEELVGVAQFVRAQIDDGVEVDLPITNRNPKATETDDCECYDDCDCEENCTCGPCDVKSCEEACVCCCDCTCEDEDEEPAEGEE